MVIQNKSKLSFFKFILLKCLVCKWPGHRHCEEHTGYSTRSHLLIILNTHICTNQQLYDLPYEDLADACPSLLATTTISEVEVAATSVQQSTYEPELSVCRDIRHYIHIQICLNASYH